MRKHPRRRVKLPHLRPEVFLTPSSAATLELVISAGTTGISLYDLESNGRVYAVTQLKELSDGGAIFHIAKRPCMNPDTAAFEDVDHYIYRGWIQ
ncbi:hypothetical protein Q6D67_04730 [Haliea sp. E1-2-M8]|uniref:hypothetical protein n=1 Tax=Haliea sp. E1-2-M8 TaxID=3064706 RepID=UPI002726E229|nr:hypothetical protein [Haliea sp. E1-2-M8]MDO8861000.1 hypothetical protein [Haliea sp. E1-2-M8]